MSQLEDLKNFIDSMQPDFEKFYTRGQNAAGTRLRKDLQELRKKAQEFRNEIQQERITRKAAKSS
ncbi:MAG: histone H1 [Bacteroidetes bacterium]|nr:histone H1 [Bacteroidota bacterium]MBU2584781.1 histone H1 [Bacteroidota bacterium]